MKFQRFGPVLEKKSSVNLRERSESLIQIEKKSRNRRFLLFDHRINTLQVEKEA